MTKDRNRANRNLFKKLMAGASALAVVSGMSTQAMGASHRATANGFVLVNATNMTNGNFNTGDTFKYDGNFTGSTGVFLGATTINEIKTLGHTPGDFSISNGSAAITISAVTTAGGGNLPIVLENGTTLILDGAAAYGGLGSVLAQNNNNGTLQITGNGFSTTATLGAGGNAINLIELNTGGNTATFGGGVVATTLQFLDGTTLNLNANLTGNVDFNNQAGTLNLYDGGTITGQVDSVANGVGGTLVFVGAGTVTQAIGANNGLTLINANGAGAVNLGHGNAVTATLIKVSDAGAVVTAGGVVTADIKFMAGGTFNLNNHLTGSIDFNNQAGTVNVDTGKTITGAVDSIAVGTGGSLIFAGNGTVTGAIGGTNALTLVKLTGVNGKAVEFQGAVKATTLQLTAGADAQLKAGGTISTLTIGNANSNVEIGHGGGAATLTFDGNVQAIDLTGDNHNITFAHNDSVLQFKAEGGKQVVVTLDAVLDPGAPNKGKLVLFADGDDAALAPTSSSLRITGAGGALGVAGGNLFQKVTVSGDKIVTSEVPINTTELNIAAGSRLNYAPGAAVSLEGVTFADAASTLSLVGRSANTTFTLNGHVDPGGVGKGIVILDSSATHVTLTGNGGVKTLGTNPNKIVELRAIGANNTVTANIDLTNVNAVNVKNGGTLASQTKTLFDVAAVTIGEAGGAGTLIADSEGQANINVLNGKTITFAHNDSLLKLTNTTNGNHAIFTLKGSLVPGGAPDDLKGKLEIDATSAHGKTITVTKQVGQTIGTDNTHRLASLLISGDQNVTIDTAVFAKKVEVTNTATVNFNQVMNLGANSTLKFTAAGNTQTAAITVTNIDFNNINRNFSVKHGFNVNVETVTNGANSSLTFIGGGTLNLGGARTVDLGSIIAGDNGKIVTLTQGAYTGNVQVIDALGQVRLSDGFILNGGFNVAGGNAGTVKFLGNATVNGVLGGAGNALGAITVAGASTLQLKGSVNLVSLDGVAGNAQTLKFINNGNIAVTGGVGLLQPFNVVEFNGAHQVKFQTAGAIGSPTLHFTANADVVTDNFDLAATNITQAGAGAAKLTVNVNQTLTGNTAAFGTLHVDGNKNIDINTANFSANITTEDNDEVTINFNTNGIAAGSVGTAGEKVHEINFNKTVGVGAVHAAAIKVNANGVVAFGGAVDAGSFKFYDNAAEASFGAINLDVQLDANAPGNGIANFDQTIISEDVGTDGARLAEANFAASESHVGANIYANAIDLEDAGTITLDGASTFTGVTTTGINSILNLTEHDITFKGGAVTLGNGTTIKTTVNGGNLGNFVAGAGSNITLNNRLNIEVTLAGALPANHQRVTLIKKDGGATVLDLNNITVTKNGGAFTSWRTELVNGELILTNESKVAEVISAAAVDEGLRDVVTEDIAQAFEDFTPGTEGESVVTLFNSFMTADGTPDEKVISDGVARLSNTTANEVVNASMEQLAMTSNVLTDRLLDITSTTLVSLPIQVAPVSVTPTGGSTIGAPTTGGQQSTGGPAAVKGTSPQQGQQNKATRVTSSAEAVGIAAGDDQDRYGAWMAPFYSRNTQKKRSSSSGYRLDTYGGTFGFDTKASDELLIGLAFTAANSDIKHKDFKSGDKTRLGSMLFSAYSNYQFGNNWFTQGVLSVGNSNIKNRENRRISTTAYGIAEAQYSSMTFAGELIAGYNYLMKDSVIITPTFGIGYSRVNDSSYKETGNVGAQLLNVTKKASQKFDLVAGLRVTGMPFVVGEMSLSPDLHASVRHDVIGKGAKVDATIPGLRTLSEKAKLQKTYFNLGAGLRATYGSMDYGAGVDTTLAKKYVGVTGTVNVRVNF